MQPARDTLQPSTDGSAAMSLPDARRTATAGADDGGLVVHRKSIGAFAVDQIGVRLLQRMMRRRRALGAPRMFVAPDDYIGETIIAEGIYEKAYLAAAATIFQGLRDRRLWSGEGLAVDIGANLGNHTLFLQRHFAAVHSFEPNPMMASVLEANLMLNGVRHVTVHRVGLSDEDRLLRFVQYDENLGGSGFLMPDEATSLPTRDIAVRHASRYLEEHLPPEMPVHCIKIDVEGLEDRVLSGLSPVLMRHRPLVLIEVTKPDVGLRILELLRTCGYGRAHEIHNTMIFGDGNMAMRFMRAVFRKMTYELRPVDAFQPHIYPMVVAAPAEFGDLGEIALAAAQSPVPGAAR